MSLAILYRRVSTGDQDLSFDAQALKLRGYAALHEMRIAAEFADEAVSGGKPLRDRPGGAQLIAYLERCRVSPAPIRHLVVAKIDRLARSAVDLLNIVDYLETAGVTVHFADMGGDSFSTAGALGRLFITLIGAFAEFELSIIRERTATAMAHKRGLGEYTGGTAPFGFDITEGKLIPNPDELAVIERMKALRASGARFSKIARWLNDSGIPTKKGLIGRWQTGNVKSVLESKLR